MRYLFSAAVTEDTPFGFLCNGLDSSTDKPVCTAESLGAAFALEQSRTLARLLVDNPKKIDRFLQEDAASLSSSQLILVSTYLDENLKASYGKRHGAAYLSLFLSADGFFPVILRMAPIPFSFCRAVKIRKGATLL